MKQRRIAIGETRCVYLDIRRLPGAVVKGSEIVKDVESVNMVWNPYGIKFVVLNIRNFNGAPDIPAENATFTEDDPNLNCPRTTKMLRLARYLRDHPENRPPKGATRIVVIYAGGTFRTKFNKKGEPRYTLGCTFSNFIGKSPGAAVFVTRPPIPQEPKIDDYRLLLAHELGHALININRKGQQVPSPEAPLKNDPTHTTDNNNLMSPMLPHTTLLQGTQIVQARASIFSNKCRSSVPLLNVGRVTRITRRLARSRCQQKIK